MKTIALISLALLVAGAAHAQDSSDDTAQNRQATPGALTRAEVRAELARAHAAGEMQDGEGGAWAAGPTGASTLTRAQVRAELARAQAAGELQNGEGISFMPTQQAGTPREREAVRAEAMQAARSHRQDTA